MVFLVCRIISLSVKKLNNSDTFAVVMSSFQLHYSRDVFIELETDLLKIAIVNNLHVNSSADAVFFPHLSHVKLLMNQTCHFCKDISFYLFNQFDNPDTVLLNSTIHFYACIYVSVCVLRLTSFPVCAQQHNRLVSAYAFQLIDKDAENYELYLCV